MNTALIIDDSRLARLTLKRLIVKHDIEVFEADGVEEAKLWLEHNPNPDVIFLDIMMPDIDGYEGLSIFKKDDNIKHVPIIMYSGDVSEDSRARAKAGGANGFLPKPADINRVDHLIAALSKRRQSQAMLNTEHDSISSASSRLTRPSPKDNTKLSDDLETGELLRSQFKHLTFRVDQLEKKNAQLSELLNDSHPDQTQRDITFLQRQLTSAVNRIKLALALAAIAIVISVIAVVMLVLG